MPDTKPAAHQAPPSRVRGTRHLRLPASLLPMVASRWGLLLAAATAFSVIAVELQMTRHVWFDAPVLACLHSLRSPSTTAFMLRATVLGNGEVLAGVAIVGTVVLWLRRQPRAAVFLGASAAGAALLNTGLKFLFERERPDVLLRLADTGGFGFPSGHSMASAATYGAIAVIALSRFPRMRIPLSTACIALVVVIGLSRAYLHVHFPSDVVAGWVLGAMWPLSLKPLLLGRGLSPERTPSEGSHSGAAVL